MSSDAPVDPAEVPEFTGDEAQLAAKVKALSMAGVKISTAAGDVHTSFGGLRAFYRAPEADQLFATTQPVQDRALEVGSDLCVVAGALGTYADDIRPLVRRLDELRRAARDFRTRVAGDEKWREDDDLIEENLDRRNEIAEVWARFQAAERACHDKIVALVGGPPLKVDDGSHQQGMYGYDAETLKQVESLPWGDAVAESTPGWQVWEHTGDFFEGFFVDGVWGTVTSLGTLVGTHGWDEAGQAWKGLGMVATGVAISATPIAGALYASAEDDELPAWLRDSRTAMKEAGKAFVAWDQWQENPGRAGGSVTFNVFSTVFTAGAGGAVSTAGRASAAAKAISFAGRAGRALDPGTYLFKGAAASVRKIGDVMTGLRGLGHVDVTLPPGTVQLPAGASVLPDGTLRLPPGAAVPPGVVAVPPGTVRLADGTPVPPGSADFGGGVVRLPADTPAPPGSVPVPEGTLRVTDGTLALPEGTLRYTDAKGATVYLTPRGDLHAADGTLLQRADDAHREARPAAAPAARQPALVGAGARVGEGADGGRLDGGSEGAEPAGGGGAGDRIPTNAVESSGAGRGDRHGAGPGPGDRSDIPPTGGARDTGGGSATNGTGHGGPAADHGTPVNARPDTPGLGALDEAAEGVDDAPRINDGAPPDAQPATSGAGDDAGDQPVSRSAEEMKRIQDEHVRLANEDPVWRAAHYDARFHRRSADRYVDGQLLPILKELPDGRLVATSNLPHADREYYRLKPVNVGLDSIRNDVAGELDDLAEAHRAYLDLGNAQRAYDSDPTPENVEALENARTAMGDRANNTKIGERLGEGAARLHAVPEVFENTREVPLMETGNGSRRFDQLYRLDDGKGDFVIVEAKAPGGTLDWRQGAGIESEKMVKQGTIEYVRTILQEMLKRGDPDKGIAEEMGRALRKKKVQYVLVHANEHTGTYAGAKLQYFDLYREGR
ncbi:hypothetical protein [Streptomyces ficellus]|uniref:Uncharacterized protein n=1 Tax=Streptomyces ficellus TaxID=1977088 RepID=A0A6I6FJF6_9ACTN|nr:hypothetical protein [Streptomyces ficellus]QGV80262.1 hypothetical protein EIZ62_20010 [Streptomyces ficellus]